MRKVMNKEKIIVVLIVCMLLPGCVFAGKEIGQAKNEASSAKEISDTAEAETIVSTVYTTNDFAVSYPDIPALTEHSEVIVYGEVEQIYYMVEENGYCYTKEEVRILKPIKGGYKEGDLILVSKEQGLISVQEYLDSFPGAAEEEMSPEISASDFDRADHIYVEKRGRNDIMSPKGQKGIYFLGKSSSYDTDQAYCRLTEEEAEYIEYHENEFVQTAELGMAEQLPAAAGGDEEGLTFSVYSLDEMIDEIGNAAE